MFKVLEPVRVGRMELRNRFMRSATWDGMADEAGKVTDLSLKLHADLAAGGVGLIVTAYSFVSKAGQAAHGQYGIHRDEMIPGFRRLAEIAHDGGAKIAAQIVHAGARSGYRAKRGLVNLAPSECEDPNPHRAMTETEIENTIEEFAVAALRVKEAGMDGVQLHGAHGFLLAAD
jgi:2,4-dienoyl-CoA reductase-like NADH-dependent reductase (Old Yellow Enzyme family)